MLKYGTTKQLPHVNSILMESWDAFKVSSGNIIRERFLKTKIPPLIPPDLNTNTQACAASAQVPFVYNSKEINDISCIKVAHIEVQETSTDYTMVVLQ